MTSLDDLRMHDPAYICPFGTLASWYRDGFSQWVSKQSSAYKPCFSTTTMYNVVSEASVVVLLTKWNILISTVPMVDDGFKVHLQLRFKFFHIHSETGSISSNFPFRLISCDPCPGGSLPPGVPGVWPTLRTASLAVQNQLTQCSDP